MIFLTYKYYQLFVYIFRSDSEDCNTRRSGSGNVATASALGLVNIGGVFVVLLVGMYAIIIGHFAYFLRMENI